MGRGILTTEETRLHRIIQKQKKEIKLLTERINKLQEEMTCK